VESFENVMTNPAVMMPSLGSHLSPNNGVSQQTFAGKCFLFVDGSFLHLSSANNFQENLKSTVQCRLTCNYIVFFEQKFYSGVHDTTQHPKTWGAGLALH